MNKRTDSRIGPENDRRASEPNAQNSEQAAGIHPSGKRIEQMYVNAANAKHFEQERGEHGEILRPSERPDYNAPEEPAEGSPGITSPHRMDQENRDRR